MGVEGEVYHTLKCPTWSGDWCLGQSWAEMNLVGAFWARAQSYLVRTSGTHVHAVWLGKAGL